MSTDAEIITVRKEIDAHKQDFTGSEVLRRLILKILAHCFHSLNDTRIARCFLQLCESVQVSIVSTDSSPEAPYCQQSSAPRQTRLLLLPCGDYS
jgi:hypothetical protein